MTPKESLRILKDLVNENTVIGDCERECLEIIEKELNQKEKQDKKLKIIKRALLYSYINRDIFNRAFEEGWITEEEHKIVQEWLEEK